MNRTLIHSFLILLLVFLTIGPIKLPLPFFTDIRKMIVVLLLLGLAYFLLNPKSRIKLFGLAQSSTGTTLLIFTLLILISSAVNIPSDGFKSVSSYLFGVMAFFFGYAILFTVNQPERLLKTFMVVVIFTSMFAVINSILVLMLEKPFIVFSNAFITDKITEYRLYDFARGRIYMLSYADLIIPFITFVFLLKPQTFIKKLGIALILMLEMLAIFLSNYRGKLLAGAMGIILIFVFKKAPAKPLLIIILIPLLVSLFFQTETGSVIDRLLLKSQEDITTLTGRMTASARATNIGLNNFFWGIGLGNFINYADWVWTSKEKTDIVSYQNPHNAYLMLFAETGFLSVAIYIILILKMAKSDFNFLVKQKFDSNNIILPFVVSSWIFIAINLIDWYPINYLVYFFLLRGLIYGWYHRVPTV